MAPITAEEKFREMALKYGMGKYGLPKTGMTTVYYPGDDGYWQFGNYEAEFRFEFSPIGEVFDQATGLAWPWHFTLKDMIWHSAIDYCNDLNNGEDLGWHLPNIHELFTIINFGLIVPQPNPDFFRAEEGQIFWSSTTWPKDTDKAYAVELYAGVMTPITKFTNGYVFPCRYSSLWRKRRGK